MKKTLTFIFFLIAGMMSYAQTNHTININGTNDGWTSRETFTNVSSADNGYFTWDADYIYFGISDAEADYGNMATFMYFDTDPTGLNGSTNAYAWGNNITTPFNADYVIVWKNQSGGDYIQAMHYNGTVWEEITSSTSTSLVVSSDTIVKFAIGTDYREVKVKRSYIGNPDAIKFCTFTEQQWGSSWRYFAWPSDGWTDDARAAGQSIPNYYGFILMPGIYTNDVPYYDATMASFTGTGNDWNTAANWSNNNIPLGTSLVMIPSGKTVEIASNVQADGYDLLNKGSLTLNSDASSTASLKIANAYSGSGTFTMERYIAAANWTSGTDGWHLLSSPVANQSISGEWTPSGSGNYDFYAWSEANNIWLNQKVGANNITTFETGKGYLVAYQQASTKSFSGNPNLNDVSFSNLSYNASQGNGWHLLGNPFSCALKWNEGSLWALTNVANTAKIWNSSTKAYIDIAQDGIIPATQGFFIQVSLADNAITIPKASRVHNTTNWYKSGEVSRIVMVASPEDGNSAQETYIRLVPGTTQEFEFEHDARFMAGYAPAFYCMVNDEKLSTQSLSDFNPGLELNYGFEKIETDNYRIVLKENPFDVNIYLHDLKTDIVQNLKQNPIYEFTSSEGDDPLRFKLKFGSVGIDEKPAVKSLAYVVDQNLYFTVSGEKRVEIFDLTGRILMHFVTSENYTTLPLTPGIYFVRVSTPSQTMSSKILIN
jgi:hypothetical protein